MFVGTLGVRFEHGARAGAVEHRGDAAFAVQARVGVKRRAGGLYRLTEDGAGVLAQGFDQRAVAGQGLERAPEAFRAMLDGNNFGKTLVAVSEDPTRA